MNPNEMFQKLTGTKAKGYSHWDRNYALVRGALRVFLNTPFDKGYLWRMTDELAVRYGVGHLFPIGEATVAAVKSYLSEITDDDELLVKGAYFTVEVNHIDVRSEVMLDDRRGFSEKGKKLLNRELGELAERLFRYWAEQYKSEQK